MLSAVWQSLGRPSEISSMFKLKKMGKIRSPPTKDIAILADELNPLDWCYAVLHRVSRSFAVVIQQLDQELKDAICIFYLVLRGLDSCEDDMEFPVAEKLPLLRSFHEKIEIDGWNMSGVGDSEDYRKLMAHFDKVIVVYKSLKPGYRDVIRDITKEMGYGMAKYCEELANGDIGSVKTVEEYNLYCHYVAGLVGIGLSQLFAASGLEDASIALEEKLANNMGLFLQKTNIIRDYQEDYHMDRTWWPQEIWTKYAPTLDWFAKNPKHELSRACLNEMITDAFKLIPDVLAYLSLLKNPTVFAFCAIPQVMAIATLVELYDNNKTFESVVKIRKGLSAEIMLNCNSNEDVLGYFKVLAQTVQNKLRKVQYKDATVAAKAQPYMDELSVIVEDVLARTKQYNAPSYTWGSVFNGPLSLTLVGTILAVSIGYMYSKRM